MSEYKINIFAPINLGLLVLTGLSWLLIFIGWIVVEANGGSGGGTWYFVVLDLMVIAAFAYLSFIGKIGEYRLAVAAFMVIIVSWVYGQSSLVGAGNFGPVVAGNAALQALSAGFQTVAAGAIVQSITMTLLLLELGSETSTPLHTIFNSAAPVPRASAIFSYLIFFVTCDSSALKMSDNEELQLDLKLKKKKKTKKPKETEAEDGTAETPAEEGQGVDDAAEELEGLTLDLKKKKKKKKKSSSKADDVDGDSPQEGGEDEDGGAKVDQAIGEVVPKEPTVDLATLEASWQNQSGKDYSYADLLCRVFLTLRQNNPEFSGERRKFQMLLPVVERDGKKSIFVNIEAVCARMKRSPKHLEEYIFAELGTQGSVDGAARLVIKGRYQQRQIENVLRKYIDEYVMCKTCKSTDTHLNKENRLSFLHCDTCGSSRTVTAIKTGFRLNIANPATGCQKSYEIDDERKLRIFYDKRISAEVAGDALGDEFKGYVFKIAGGNDKQGFPMKQGVLLPHRVRLLLTKGASCYRPRRTGERKRKSVRGCIVGSDMAALSLVVVKQGEQDLPGLTDEVNPKRLGPKRANKIRKMFNLTKEDDVRKFVVRRELPAKEGKKPSTKAPKIQRLVTPVTLQRKRRRLALKKKQVESSREAAMEYAKLLAKRLQEQKAKRAEVLKKRRLSSSRKSQDLKH
ncbi:hypothetical protein MP638_006963 [Amoeboaphelidium occidentale]|nr:hypothetical protein MP638_006963 [Amoeboaphelidium occidentale]